MEKHQQYYLAKAKEAEELAARCKDTEQAAAWARIADSYRMLARGERR